LITRRGVVLPGSSRSPNILATLLDEQPSHQIVASVMERRVELGIVADSVDLGGLKTRTVRADPLVVCTAATDPLAQRISIPCLHLRETARPPPTHQGPLDQLADRHERDRGLVSDQSMDHRCRGSTAPERGRDVGIKDDDAHD
jgi:DNA-binding transcriptional LysR family regulator